MSIVGTRPPLISETNLYEPRHKARLDVFNVYQEKNPNAMLVMIGDGEQKEIIKEKVHSLNLDNSGYPFYCLDIPDIL